MKPIFRLGVRDTLFLILFLLSACTGTQEERLPTLLAVALNDREPPEVALVSTERADPAEDVYPILENSRQSLAAPAAAFDVTGRNGLRDELVVLSRDTEDEGYLDFFSLRGVDPLDPAAFGPSEDRPRLTLSELEDAAEDFCPRSVQASNTGRYVAVLNGTDCGDESDVSIDVIDVRERQVLRRISGGTFGLVEAEPYFEQQTDTLYYLQRDVTNAKLIALDVPELTDDEVATVSGRDQVDISQQGSNLLVLRPSEILIVPLDGSETTSLATRSGSRQFVDGQPPEDALLILGSNTLTVHTSLLDEDEQSEIVTTAYGTLNTPEGFAYFSSPQGVVRFDLLRYMGSFSGLLRTFRVDEFTESGPITHFTGIIPNEPQP